MPAEHERIGPTAHYTAYVWKRLGLPHAELFATPTGAALYWTFFAAGEWTTRLPLGVPSMARYLEYRHRLIEAVVRRIRPDRLVELGAGLSRRGVTWALDGVPAFDVDLPTMAAAKRRALDAAPPGIRAALGERHRVVDADVLDPAFGDRLAGLLTGSERPVVVAEGLMSYFARDDRQRLLEAVAGALPDDGVLVCDLHTADAQARVGHAARYLRLAIRVVTRRRRALDPYRDESDLRAAFARVGFFAVTLASAAAYVDIEPRLAALSSPTHVVVARLREPATS